MLSFSVRFLHDLLDNARKRILNEDINGLDSVRHVADLDSAEVGVDAGVAAPGVRPLLAAVSSPRTLSDQTHILQCLSDKFEFINSEPRK